MWKWVKFYMAGSYKNPVRLIHTWAREVEEQHLVQCQGVLGSTRLSGPNRGTCTEVWGTGMCLLEWLHKCRRSDSSNARLLRLSLDDSMSWTEGLPLVVCRGRELRGALAALGWSSRQSVDHLFPPLTSWGLWVLSDTQVLAALRELRVHRYTLWAHILFFHFRLFTWLHEDEGTTVNPYATHRHTLYLFC